MGDVTAEQQLPTKICAHCSVQSTTDGDFCPHCGRSFLASGSSSRILKYVAIAVIALLVIGVAAIGVVMKINHDNAVEASRIAAHHRAVARERAQAAAEQRAAARREADRQERSVRHQLIRQMQASITKDAKKEARSGLLDGPIYYTTCDPLGGGSTDDLTALTTTFSCLAVDKKNGDGTVQGYRFSATANWNESSYTWHLGN